MKSDQLKECKFWINRMRLLFSMVILDRENAEDKLKRKKKTKKFFQFLSMMQVDAKVSSALYLLWSMKS